MTVAKLLKNKRFLKFCVIEYGIKVDDLIETDGEYLFQLMTYWYECPECYMGPRGVIRGEVEQALSDGKLKESRYNNV